MGNSYFLPNVQPVICYSYGLIECYGQFSFMRKKVLKIFLAKNYTSLAKNLAMELSGFKDSREIVNRHSKICKK